MSNSINNAFVDDFESRVHQVGQQEVSRVRDCVRNRMGTGDIYNFERLASSDMTNKATTGGRHSPTPINNVAHDRRRAGVETFDWGEAVDNSDLAQILIDPDSEYVQSAGMAYGRKLDEIILDATVSDTRTTDGAGAALGFAADGGTIIGDGTQPLSVDYLRQAKRTLDEAEVMGARHIAISAKGLEDLLNVTEVASFDYNTVKALVMGELDTFMGFNFRRTELVPRATSGSDNVIGIGAVCWVEPCMAIAISDDRFTRIGEDPGLRFSNRIYMETTFGACRVEGAGVVLIDHVV